MTGPRDPRDRALELLGAWERGEGFADQLLDAAQGEIEPGQRALVRELLYGTIRRRRGLDYVLRKVCHRDPRGLTPALRNILRIGAYQLLHLDRVPDALAVDAAVRQVHAREGGKKKAGFVNAVLRSIARSGPPPLPSAPFERLGIASSHPDWLVRRWVAEHGRRTASIMLEWHNQVPPTVLAPNPLRLDPGEDLAGTLAGEGVATRPAALLPGYLVADSMPGLTDLPSFRSGRFYVQDESAGLFTRAAERPPGPALDACAAPGGKAMGLAIAGGDGEAVVALDRSAARIGRLRQNRLRTGLSSIRPMLGDARRLPLAGSVSLVFLDAPCSGTGVLRRRPDLRWRLQPEQIEALVRLQNELLDALAERVVRGGTLVYSTCSIEPEENRGVVQAFLDRRPDFEAIDVHDARLHALHGERGGLGADPGALLLPAVYETDGGYAAVLRRKSGRG